MNRIAIYAGTFDPITLGHLDVVQRASAIFPKLIVAVAADTGKKDTLFDVGERVRIVREAVRPLGRRIAVEAFRGLLVHYARERGVRTIIRGLRAFSDFEFEFQMALTNRKLAPDIETLFLMPKEDFSYLNSSTIREIARLGGSVTDFVPPASRRALARKLGRAGARARGPAALAPRRGRKA